MVTFLFFFLNEGVPAVIALTCGILGVYGEYKLEVIDTTTNSNTTFKMYAVALVKLV